MSDLGGDMGNTSVNAMSRTMAKLFETLIALINKIYETWRERSSAEYKLSKLKLDEAKKASVAKKEAGRIDGLSGYMNYKDLQKTGATLSVTPIKCTEQELKDISAACKRNGIKISALEDVRSRELGGAKLFTCVVKQEDLARFTEIIDVMNDAKRIDKLKADRDAIFAKGDAMTAGEKEAVKRLDEQIVKLRNGNRDILNDMQVKGAVEQAVDGKSVNTISFDTALDRFTGGAIDKDVVTYIVDAKNPDSYIAAHAKMDEFEGTPYIKTDYEVYKGNDKVYATHDGRFQGRPKDYWPTEKAAMKEKGGFGDTVVKFYSLKEMEAYRAEFARQNAQELEHLQPGVEGRDYAAIEQSLMEKIDECGGRFDEATGKVVDKQSGEEFTTKDGMTTAEQAAVAEAVVCGKQIVAYRELESAETELSIATANREIASVGTAEEAKAQAELSAAEANYKEAVKRVDALIDDRKGVNFVQSKVIAEEQTAEQSRSEESPRREESEQVIDARDERIDEWQNAASEARAEQAAKTPDFAGQITRNDRPLENAAPSFERG